MHIAIVDDDTSVRRALARVLAAASFEVTAFASAEEFLVRGLEPVPDCVLVDVHLPIMNGMELQRRMAMVKPDVRFVFITADHELAQREARDNCRIWLTKPVDEQTLIDAITRAFEAGPRLAST